MPKTDPNTIKKDGEVVQALKNTQFRVQLDEMDEEGNPVIVKAFLGGKLRRYYIRIVTGDRVQMEFSPHDLTNGRIIYRYK